MYSKMARLVIGLLCSSVALAVVFVSPATAFDIDGMVPNMTISEVKSKLSAMKFTNFIITEDKPSSYYLEARLVTENTGIYTHYKVGVCKKTQRIHVIDKYYEPTPQNFIIASNTFRKQFGKPYEFSPDVFKDAYTLLNVSWEVPNQTYSNVGVSFALFDGQTPPPNLFIWMSTGDFCN